MSPKAQRPLRGAKALSSPSSRPSGEASLPSPPTGKPAQCKCVSAAQEMPGFLV